MNNRHFANFLDLVLEVAEQQNAEPEEQVELLRVKTMRDEGEFWPGRGLVLEDDFQGTSALQFWARVSFETAQSIFLREVGAQSNSAWQAQMIYFAHATGLLFLDAFQDAGGDPKWYPGTRSQAEFRSLVEPVEADSD